MTSQEFTDYLAACGRAEEVNAQLNKLGFTTDFVIKNVLSAQETVTVSRVAMLWQGMPNKHDRKRTRALFDTLTEIGLLASLGDEETWTVVSAR